MQRNGVRLLVAAVVLACGAAPAVAQADTALLDFESAPPAIDTPITTEYEASNFVYFQQSDGFRPYRETVAAGRAHSGTVIADIGPSHCPEEDPGGGADCEFAVGGTTARLTRTAQSLTVYTGFYTGAVVPDVALELTAYRADGTVAGSATSSEIDSTNITTPVTVTSAAADIEHVRMSIIDTTGGSANVGAELGIDDLSLTYPAGSLPEVSVSAPAGPFAALRGQTTDVPITLGRLNGSNGDVALSSSGLPSGVTATFTPDPVPAAQTTAIMHLTASSIAPTFDNPQTVTITADPQGDPAVAPAARSTTTTVRVGGDFTLQTTAATPSAASVPACGSIDVPFILSRDRAFTGTVTLTLTGLPANVSAQFLPGTSIAPGGDFDVQGTLRLTAGQSFVSPTTMTIHANATGAPESTLTLGVGRFPPRATIDQANGNPPQFLQPGSYVHVSADGVCPGTEFRIGQSDMVPATIDANGRGFSFTVPHGAATGPVTIVPPSGTGPSGNTSNSITITPYASINGFPFDNFAFGSLSFSELVEEFGDNLFIHVNPCIVVDCTINTYIPDPTVLIVWPVLNHFLQASGGHCFGITRGIQELLAGTTALSRFSSSARQVHDLGSSSGPTPALSDWLDAKHAAQGSAEFLYAWVTRDKNLEAQWTRAHDDFLLGRPVMVTLQEGSLLSGEGHAVLAYDEQEVSDGHDLLVYNNNAHDKPDGTQRIHISADWSKWTFDNNGSAWSGGSGSLFVARRTDIPTTPTLPGIGSLLEGLTTIFGSSGGSAQTTAISPGEDALPVLDDHAAPGSAGMFVLQRRGAVSTHRIRGRRNGSYEEAIAGPGFAAGVSGVATHSGVTDLVTTSSSRHSLTFASGMNRPLALRLGDNGHSVSYSATLATHVEGGHTDSAALRTDGQLSYVHAGTPTTMSFTLTSARTGGAVQTFASPRITVGSGEHVTIALSGAGRARLVSLVHGRRRTQTLRSVTRAAARVRVGTLVVNGSQAKLALRIDRLSGSAVLGAALKITRGRTTLARRGLSVANLRSGARTVSFHIPRLARGRYAATVQIEVLAGTTTVRTAAVTRRFTLRVG